MDIPPSSELLQPVRASKEPTCTPTSSLRPITCQQPSAGADDRREPTIAGSCYPVHPDAADAGALLLLIGAGQLLVGVLGVGVPASCELPGRESQQRGHLYGEIPYADEQRAPRHGQQSPAAGADGCVLPGSTRTGTASPIRSCVAACWDMLIWPVSPRVLCQVMVHSAVALTGY